MGVEEEDVVDPVEGVNDEDAVVVSGQESALILWLELSEKINNEFPAISPTEDRP